jgi:hypothetical protein
MVCIGLKRHASAWWKTLKINKKKEEEENIRFRSGTSWFLN